VKPVNLLPSELRPRRASGAQAGSAYFVVGGLAVLLLMLAAYVLTSNQVTSRENQRAEALQQTQAAEARVASLTSFGDFATVAETRQASVKQLAGGRFDWERLTRELSQVLPGAVWLTEVDAAVVPETTGAAGGEPASTSPTAKLSGCAKHQPDVAKFMVRLRQMHRVTDVELKESSKTDETSSSGAGDASGASGAGGEGCGDAYTFELTVVFGETEQPTAPGAGGADRVPTRLGGGR